MVSYREANSNVVAKTCPRMFGVAGDLDPVSNKHMTAEEKDLPQTCRPAYASR